MSVGAGLLDITPPRTLSELTARTLRLAERLRQQSPRVPVVPKPNRRVALRRLPGTIAIGGVPWANGELPAAVKRAGGGRWTWEVGDRVGQPHVLIALARKGARLGVDDRLLVDCPAGQAYVPATQRCPPSARASFTPTKPRHQIRLELSSRKESQDASVLLAAGNLHLAPWSADHLAHPARLPSAKA